MGNHGGDFKTPPIFQSGLGKSVTVKQSSITKALSIFSDKSDTIADRGHLLNGSDKGSCFPNSMFQTASGKKVNICSAGLVRAKTLLGLQEHYNHDGLFGTEQSKNQSNELFGWQNSFLETEEGANTLSYEDATTPLLPILNVKNMSFQSGIKCELVPNFINSGSKCLPIKFQSAGGRSISVSNGALQHAQRLLGDLEHGSLFGEDDATFPSLSFRGQGGRGVSGNYSKKLIFYF